MLRSKSLLQLSGHPFEVPKHRRAESKAFSSDTENLNVVLSSSDLGNHIVVKVKHVPGNRVFVKSAFTDLNTRTISNLTTVKPAN